MQQLPFDSEQRFRFNVIKGQIAKELVKGLLEISGYEVSSFGYESSHSHFRYHVGQQKGRVIHTASNDRMRSMPDLIMHDKDTHETSFVEVKFRKADPLGRITLTKKELTWTSHYWSDCVLVVVTPALHNFYAQRINDITIFAMHNSHRYGLHEFKHIEDVFKIKPEDVERYKVINSRFQIHNGSEQEDTEE